MGIARLYYRLVKFEHTIFALPFAYVGAFLAVEGVPSAHDLLWITVAMVGARSLAMALNRLIDARIDAANPRTAGRELPSGALTHAAVIVFCVGVARGLPRRGLAARPARPLALADPGDRVRRLPVPEAVHVDCATSGSARSTGSRRSAPGPRSRGSCRGSRGRSARPSPRGSPASTSSTRCSTPTSIASRGCTPGRRASASVGAFTGARILHLIDDRAADRRRARRLRRRGSTGSAC